SIVPAIREEFTPNSGDIPAVQERFEALLKSRLSLEIEQNLPLFPWEDEVLEYQSDWAASMGMADNVVSGLSKSGSLWLAQLRRLTTPVALPETMLASLLAACESVVPTSLREGVKVVKVAESFFPENFLQLNELAGIVMMSPARNGYASLQSRLGELDVLDVPTTYEAATPTQQMVLSLLAAREMIAALTLTLKAGVGLSHQWMTEIGALTLQLDYRIDGDDGVLHIQGQLPCGGSLSLVNGPSLSMAQRPEAGMLSVELADLRPMQPLQLKVQLGSDDSIVFAIVLMS
ncbi:MAG: hypothetical protein LH631_03805, partial [Alkalinema sp. CAN_BIN05]|nr:hypothetical protein [Alkalinema sp. CAN_BIN05]